MFTVPRNTVKFRGSPAAVIPSFSFKKGKLLSKLCHCFVFKRNGKAAKKAGEPEDLL